MSPTKAPPANSKRTGSKMPAGIASSTIPRRVKPSNATSKRRKNLGSSGVNSIFKDPTATEPVRRPQSYLSAQFGANKENIPVSGATRSRHPRANISDGSPTRGKTGINKLKKSPLSLKAKALARVPLRELTESEVFERDDAVLGDLRRRRSGEHSGVVEFDSVLAHPFPSARNVARASSVTSSIATFTTTSSQSTAPTELDEGAADGEKDETLRVLRKTENEESLRLKVDAIIAATAAGSTTDASKSVTRQSTLKKKLEHPAVKSVVSTPSQPSSPEFSFQGSPVVAPATPSLRDAASPILSRRSPSPIMKSSPSPTRTPLSRIGLGVKSVNTLLKEATTKVVENSKGDKAKKIIVSSNSTTNSQPKKLMKKKAGASSLRRAAGAARPTTTTAGSSGRVVGLAQMRTLR